jgi:DNA polymerase-4
VERWIAHLDMDAFFVSVERLVDPSLKGKPVVVGGDPDGRGVVASASYEARRFGIRSAMPSRRARELCPGVIFLRGHHHLYGDYHRKVRAILERSVPVIEGASIDEFYLDLSGCTLLHGAIPTLLRKVRREIADKLGLPSSAGLAGNKLVAKIASGIAKPQGVLWVPRGTEACFLSPLPIRILPGVGPATEKELTALGIRRVGHLASFPVRVLEGTLGKGGVIWPARPGASRTHRSQRRGSARASATKSPSVRTPPTLFFWRLSSAASLRRPPGGCAGRASGPED